jgi:hypothetical protein
MSYTEDRSAVKRLTRQIDQAEADADAWKWERAERLARMCETKPKREVARDVNISDRTLRDIIQVWESVGAEVPPHQTYTEAYYAVRPNRSAKFGKDGGRNTKERAATATAILKDPEVVNHVLRDPKTRQGLVRTIADHPAARREAANTIEVREAIHENRAKRAAQQPTPVQRKEQQAAIREFAEPALASAADLMVSAVVVGLEDAVANLSELEGTPSKRAVKELVKVYKELGVEVQVLAAMLELEDV